MKPEKAADFFIQRAKRSQPNALCVKKSWLRFPEKVAVGSERQSGSFLEQDSTTVPKSAYLRFCPFGKSCWGVPSPNPAMRLVPLENPTKKYLKNRPQNGGKWKELIPIGKRYNTPHRSRVVKTRMTEEEYADFTERLKNYDMSQAEFIRQAITRATIRPIVTVSPVNDELLSAVGKLTAEYGKIGGNLNQIARSLNEYGTPYNALSVEVRAAISDLAALKFEVLRKVGDAVGNIQTYQL